MLSSWTCELFWDPISLIDSLNWTEKHALRRYSLTLTLSFLNFCPVIRYTLYLNPLSANMRLPDCLKILIILRSGYRTCMFVRRVGAEESGMIWTHSIGIDRVTLSKSTFWTFPIGSRSTHKYWSSPVSFPFIAIGFDQSWVPIKVIKMPLKPSLDNWPHVWKIGLIRM